VAWRALGDSALWAPRPNGASARVLFTELRSCAGVVDAVVTEEKVCVYFNPGRVPTDLDGALERAAVARAPTEAREFVIRTRYDGLDLQELAARNSQSDEAIVAAHAAGVYVVTLMGFLPGFAYLTGQGLDLVAPRRPVPRPRVEAGSVAVAAGYTAVYPFASPGGWNVIGHAVGFEPFRSDTGATLRLGDHVRFERVG
jgi:UPF0271 protein